MKFFFIISGFFILIFICLVPLKTKIAEFDVYKNGELVPVAFPNPIGAKVSHPLKFTYLGNGYSIMIKGTLAEKHKVGDTILMRHKDGNAIFLLPTKNMYFELFAIGTLAVFSIFLIAYGLKK